MKTNKNLARAALWLVVRNNLRGRPGQNLLIGLMIAVSSLLFAVALSILGGLDRPFERMSEELKASHFVMLVDTDIYDTDELASWWAKQSETAGVVRFNALYSQGFKPFFKGKELATMVSYAEYQAQPVQDKLKIIESVASPQLTPALDEIWIPSSLANQNGIKVGDVLAIPTDNGQLNLKVAAIVVDPQYSSGYINPVRLWLAPGALSTMFPPERLNQEILAVRLHDYAQSTVVWNKFNQHLGGAFNGTMLEYASIKMAFTWMLRMLGSAMLVFSILACLACILLVHNTISSALRQDYRQIGILKSIGFTPSQTTQIYIIQYLTIAAAALIPGTVLSWFLSGQMLASLAMALGVDSGSSLSSLGPILIAIPVFLGLVALAAATSGRTAGKISAVAAIRFGSNQSQQKAHRKPSKLYQSNAPVSVLLALRSLGQNRKRAVISGVAVLFAAFIMLTANDTVALFSGIGSNLGQWGFIDSDITLVRNGKRFTTNHDALMADMRSNPSIKTVIPRADVEASMPASADTRIMTLFGQAYESDPSTIGLSNTEGRHPRTADEISLGSNTAKMYGKTIGDIVHIYIRGKDLEYRICGIYQAVGEMGQGFRLTGSGFRRADPGWQPAMYELMLSDPKTRTAVIGELQARWGESIETRDMRAIVQRVTTGMVAGLSGAFVFMVLIFLGVAMVAIASGSAMDINESLRNLALMKTMGYTPGQLRLALALKFAIIGFAAGLAGLLLNLLVEPALLQASMGGLGLVSYQREFGWSIPAILATCSVVAALSTIIPSRRLSVIKVRSLICE